MANPLRSRFPCLVMPIHHSTMISMNLMQRLMKPARRLGLQLNGVQVRLMTNRVAVKDVDAIAAEVVAAAAVVFASGRRVGMTLKSLV